MVDAAHVSATRATTPPSPCRAKISHRHLVSARPANSNRHKMQLESSVTSRKQTTAPDSNRHKFCPKSGPALRPTAVTKPNSPLTAPKSATVSSIPLFPFSLIATQILDFALTRSQQTRKHFLIATISGIALPAPRFTHHSLLVTRPCLTSFLFDTNERARKKSNLFKTNKKTFLLRTLERFSGVLFDTFERPSMYPFLPVTRHGRIAAL